MSLVGQRAPDFTLASQHGESVRLQDLVGAPALVVFFPFAFSGICSSELADLRDHRGVFDDAGVRLVGISCDPMFALRVFDDRDALGFTLLSDFWPHGSAARAWGCFDERTGAASRGSFLLDEAGIVRWKLMREAGEKREIEVHLGVIEELSGDFRQNTAPDRPE
ncbi:redoxin domain-containing protein [Aeromicrobium sp. CF3.5]|uniref:redoxin domain-containing protein n=1 Tax=Aeromicrobium sp. CF3.5 TaxID=3373078 RepID=UPI003EE7E077